MTVAIVAINNSLTMPTNRFAYVKDEILPAVKVEAKALLMIIYKSSRPALKIMGRIRYNIFFK